MFGRRDCDNRGYFATHFAVNSGAVRGKIKVFQSGTKIWQIQMTELNPIKAMTTSLELSPHEEKSIQFFREIKNDLGSSSMVKIVKVVRVVLSQIRKSLSHEQATIFIKSLPSVFQLLFIANWKYSEANEASGSIRHLDELIDTLYEQDRRSGMCLFHSEIDTLNTVILILTKLDKFFGAMGLKIFQHSLTQELKQAASSNVV